MTISTLDTVVIGAYLACVVLLGVWTGRNNRDLSDYLLGGRTLPWWALLGSIVATETSTATFLSVPGLTFAAGGDMRFLQLCCGYIVGRILVTRMLLPAYFAGELFTAYEVLHRRFGVIAQRFASALFLVARNVGDGLRLFLAALAVEAATGLSLTSCVVIVAAVTVFYTLFGGMKSVVWNDCLQLLVYLAGGVATLWLLAGALSGGWGQLLAFGVEEHKFRVFDFSWNVSDPLTFWAGFVGGAFLSLGTHGADQMIVQRLLSARSQREAGRALIMSGGVVLLQFALFLLIGVGLAAYFAQHPPGEAITKGDAAYAEYIVRHMPAGLAGLVLAAVFAAAMSTLSSSLNSSAATLVSDFSGPSDGSAATARRRLALSRAFTVVFGVIQAGLAMAAARLSQSVVMDALAIAGFTAGVMLGVFGLGLFTRRAGQWAAVAGMLGGLSVLGFIKLATTIAWPWYPVIGCAATFAVGWCCGWITTGSRGRKQLGVFALTIAAITIPIEVYRARPQRGAPEVAAELVPAGSDFPQSVLPFERRPFGPKAEFPSRITNVQIVDLDRDGMQDVVACDALTNQVVWHRQSPRGSWDVRVIAEDLAAPAHATIVDLDADGDLDVLVAVLGNIFPDDSHVGRVVWLERVGDAFVSHVLLDDVRRVADVQAGDLDGDGDLDLAVAVFGYARGQILWLENRGGGRFRDHELHYAPGAIHVPLADFDGDGDLDIATVFSQNEEEIWGFENLGGGQFRPRLLHGTVNFDLGSAGLVATDLDSDGDADLLWPLGDNLEYQYTYPQPYHGCIWLENEGNWEFTPRRIARFGGCYAAAAADLDADGDRDVVLVSLFNDWQSPGRASIVWLENDGRQTFRTWQIDEQPTRLVTVACGDLDGDGRDDIVAGALHVTRADSELDGMAIWTSRGDTP